MTQKPNNDPKKEQDTQQEKTELAQFIADKSQKISKQTESLTNGAQRIIRWLSNGFDRVLFNPRHGKLVAFVVAFIVYIAFNSNSVTTPLLTSLPFDAPVNVTYNSEMYEITEIPKTVSVLASGSQSDISMINTDSSNIKATLDLTGYTEGTHQVKYAIEGVSTRVRTNVTPESVTVTIKIKNAKKVELGYDFINRDKLDPRNNIGDVELELHEVSIKASQDTLDKVAFVKALIDVGGRTASFEDDAKIVAYDQTGAKLDQVDIIPKTVKAKVSLDQNGKSVKIIPVFEGNFPEGKHISDYKLDNDTITIYGPQETLENITSVRVPIQAAQLDKDTVTLQQTVSLPANVRYGSVSKVNIEINMGEAVTKDFEDMVISYRSKPNNLDISPKSADETKITITVTGAAESFDTKGFDINNVDLYIDLRDAKAGNDQEFEVFAMYNDDTNAPYFKIKVAKEHIVMDVIER